MGRVSTCQKKCNTIDLRRAQVNEFTDLPGIAKQIRELTDALCGRIDLSIVWFADVRGDLYSGTAAAPIVFPSTGPTHAK